VDQRVEPDVHRLLRITGEGNPPGEPDPRDGNILESVLEEPHHLVAADFRFDLERPGPDALEHVVPVRAQPEKMISLPGANQLQGGMLDAMPIDDLGFLLELLAAGAVEALVFGDVEMIGIALLDPFE